VTGAFTHGLTGGEDQPLGAHAPGRQAGASAASSVSATTRFLLAGASVGAAKTDRAAQLAVEVVDQVQLWAWLLAAGVL
jgi:DNA ligase (NAD+)